MTPRKNTEFFLLNIQVMCLDWLVDDEYSFYDSHGNGKDGLPARDTDGNAVLIKIKYEKNLKEHSSSRYTDIDKKHVHSYGDLYTS